VILAACAHGSSAFHVESLVTGAHKAVVRIDDTHAVSFARSPTGGYVLELALVLPRYAPGVAVYPLCVPAGAIGHVAIRGDNETHSTIELATDADVCARWLDDRGEIVVAFQVGEAQLSKLRGDLLHELHVSARCGGERDAGVCPLRVALDSSQATWFRGGLNQVVRDVDTARPDDRGP
jgi:hypothetical protein